MQKSQIIYLVLQTTYEQIQIGLFCNQRKIDVLTDSKLAANATLIAYTQDLLRKNNISFHELSFIAANQGPGPFTSLRVILATINGICFSSNVPLIGLDGLKSFVHEHRDEEWPITVALFNAYNQDCYYALEQPSIPLQVGYTRIDQLAIILPSIVPVRAIGEGVLIFNKELSKLENIYIPKPLPLHVTIDFLAKIALDCWHEKNNLSSQLLPLYLKQIG